MNLFGCLWLIYLASGGWLGDLLSPAGNLVTKIGWQSATLFQPSAPVLSLVDSDCIWLRRAGCTVWNPAQAVAASKAFETLPSQMKPVASSYSDAASAEVVVNPLGKLYSRLAPWLRSDRSANVANPVTLIHADSVPTSVMEGTQLFDLCDIHDGNDRAIAYQSQAPYQVWVHGQQVMALPSQSQAQEMVRSLRLLLQREDFDPNRLHPQMVNGVPGLVAGNTVLLLVNENLVQAFQRNADLLAMEWINNLREAMGAPQLSLADAQAHLYSLGQSEETLGGIASWYGPYFHKRLTANGERFNQYEFTAAHKTLEFGTVLRVTNLANGRSVIVRINDRGPYIGERSLDLSYQAALCLDGDEAGLMDYEAVILQPDERPATIDLPIEEVKTEPEIAGETIRPLASRTLDEARQQVD